MMRQSAQKTGSAFFPAAAKLLLLALLMAWIGSNAAAAQSDGAKRHYRTTEEVLADIIPTVREEDQVKSTGMTMPEYKPELGDVLFRVGLSEMSGWYSWFFKEKYTHSCIVTQVEPEVIITHCTKDRYISGVNTKPLVKWAINSKGIEVYRLKGRDDAKVAKLLEGIQAMLDEGVLFDASWDFRKAFPQLDGSKRRMYCTVFVWQAFQQIGVNLCPEPHTETNWIRKGMLWIGGARGNYSFITVDKLRHSTHLEKIAEFQPNVFRVHERIRVRGSGARTIGDYQLPPELERVANPDPNEMIPVYRSDQPRVLKPNPVNQLRRLRNPDLPTIPLTGLQVEQRIQPYGHFEVVSELPYGQDEKSVMEEEKAAKNEAGNQDGKTEEDVKDKDQDKD